MGGSADDGDAVPRNRTSASVVPLGFSSITQCPVLGSTTDVAFVATSVICLASAAPFAFSPPIDSTGIVSFVCENVAKSVAACWKDMKYAQAARIRPGRE